MNKKIIGIFLGMLMLMTIPLAAGMDINTGPKEKTTNDNYWGIRIWFVSGTGVRESDPIHGDYFSGSPGYIGFYIGLPHPTIDAGWVLSGVIWKNAKPTSELKCHFFGSMDSNDISGIYVVKYLR
jgi:hypothetical protein